MKWLAYLLPVVGFLSGLWLSRGFAEKVSRQEVLPVDPAVGVIEPIDSPDREGASSSVRLEGDEVWIPREEIGNLALESSMCRLRMDEDGFPCVDALNDRLGMSESEKWRLRELLKSAARERLEWERENVKVTKTGPADFELRYPGEGGEAQRRLREGIREILGAERTELVDLFGDIDGFFGMKWIAPSFRRGGIRVRTRKADSWETHRGFEKTSRIALSVAIGEGPAFQYHLDGASLDESIVRNRILPLLGGSEVVRRAILEDKR